MKRYNCYEVALMLGWIDVAGEAQNLKVHHDCRSYTLNRFWVSAHKSANAVRAWPAWKRELFEARNTQEAEE